EENGIATLQNPSVVNGAQTLYAISASKRMRSPALVAVRVIIRGMDGGPEDDSWLQKVIRGVNTQNRVLKFDFSSNEPEQVELQHLFQEFKVFYERKRGEWKEVRNDPRFRGFSRLSLKNLGLILTAVSDDTGDGVLLIKQGVERVFDEKHYRSLFPSRSKVARRFKKTYLAYRLSRFLKDYGYPDAKTRRRQGHAWWNALWLLSRGISAASGDAARCTPETIRAALDAFESYGATGRHARAAIRKLTKVVWQAWRKARKTDPERWTPNNFFKSAYGNRQLLMLAYPKIRQDLRSLGTELLS
ncbi:MAG TPA: AIPR family protein, partial [Phycisphaerae bacterium]|nr:AIPR family protein [Phycisphaerae bacterium]